jgi:chemotaxis protein CheZ
MSAAVDIEVQTHTHAEYLARLKEIVSALEAGDDSLFEQRLNRLICMREEGLLSNVVRITRELHRAVKDINFDNQLSDIATSGIPDACQRLDYVVTVTEEAAHKTLDLVDRSREQTERITQAAAQLSVASDAEPIIFLQASIDDAAQNVRGHLTALAQTQEYQDLTGQIIKRVIRVVRDVENALISLLRSTGTKATVTPIRHAREKLEGPTVPGLNTSASQQDADALLSELGF